MLPPQLHGDIGATSNAHTLESCHDAGSALPPSAALPTPSSSSRNSTSRLCLELQTSEVGIRPSDCLVPPAPSLAPSAPSSSSNINGASLKVVKHGCIAANLTNYISVTKPPSQSGRASAPRSSNQDSSETNSSVRNSLNGRPSDMKKPTADMTPPLSYSAQVADKVSDNSRL